MGLIVIHGHLMVIGGHWWSLVVIWWSFGGCHLLSLIVIGGH